VQNILWEGDTPHSHYQVADTLYDGREARVLFSGDQQAAQSGIAKDGNPDMLFDYSQRLLELAVGLVPKRILLIGGGVFTLPAVLLKALPHTLIDVIEPDPGLPELARRFFDLPDNDRMTMYTTDGRAYLREYIARYDLILVDAYDHMTIPRDIKTAQAFEAYRNHLETKGVLAMNVISSYNGSGVRTLQEVYAAAIRTFDTVDIFLASHGYSMWLPQNFILTAQKGQDLQLRDYVRYETVVRPEVDPKMTLDD
jgi:spermidine synthase